MSLMVFSIHCKSSSVFSLAKSLQLILGNSATYRLLTNLLICRLRAQCMISKSKVKSTDSEVIRWLVENELCLV